MTEGGARPGVGPSALRLLDICSSNTCHCQSALSYYGQRSAEKKTHRRYQEKCEEKCLLWHTVQAWPCIREAKNVSSMGLYAGNSDCLLEHTGVTINTFKMDVSVC